MLSDPIPFVRSLIAGGLFIGALLHPAYAAPVLTGSASVVSTSGSRVLVGHTLEYTVTVRNDGTDPANGLVISGGLATGTSYVPGSLRITSGQNSGTKTDAAGDDQAEYQPAGAGTWTFRLGAGANATAGGTLAPGDSTTLQWQATVDCLCPADGTFRNEARVSRTGDPAALTLPMALPFSVAAASIPSMNGWGVLVLSGLLALGGFFRRRRT